MMREQRKLYDAHAAREELFEVEYLKHISAHYDVETRVSEQFAWIPKRSEKGSIVWLKPYIIYEKYYNVYGTTKVLHQTLYSKDEFVEAKLKGEIKIG